MKTTKDGWIVVNPKTTAKVLNYEPAQIIIECSLKDLQLLAKEATKSAKYWRSKKNDRIKRFFKHLNKNISFFVSY